MLVELKIVRIMAKLYIVQKMSWQPLGQVDIELDPFFRFCQISIGPGTRNLKKNLNAKSIMAPPFKLPVKKKLILKVSII